MPRHLPHLLSALAIVALAALIGLPGASPTPVSIPGDAVPARQKSGAGGHGTPPEVLAWFERLRDAEAQRSKLGPAHFFGELDALLNDPVTAAARARGTAFLPPAFGPAHSVLTDALRPRPEQAQLWVQLLCQHAIALSRDTRTEHLAARALGQALDLIVLLDDGSAVAYADRCELEGDCLQALSTLMEERQVPASTLRRELEPRLRRAAHPRRLRRGLQQEAAAWYAALRGDTAHLELHSARRTELGFHTLPAPQLTESFLARHTALKSSVDGVCSLWPATERAAPAEPLVYLLRQEHWNRSRLELARLALELFAVSERFDRWPATMTEIGSRMDGLLPAPACVHVEFAYRRTPTHAILEWTDARTDEAVLDWSWRR